MDSNKTSTEQLSGLVQFYAEKVRAFQNDIRSVAWGSEQSQEKRFEIFASMASLSGQSILDVGCGLGSFYGWLKRSGIPVEYTGVDITAEMVAIARQNYPDANFAVENILDRAQLQPDYDYVFASGIFNRRVPEHERFINETISRMFALCRKGCAFNILSTKADFMEPEEYYADPGEMLDFCLTLSRKAILRHDYMPHDFTVIVYKD